MIKYIIFAAIFIVITMAMYLFFPKKRIDLGETHDSAKKAILSVVPIGTDTITAKRKMEKIGFDCDWHENMPWDKTDLLENYLYCDTYEDVRFPVSKRWQVALFHKENEIQRVALSSGLIAP